MALDLTLAVDIRGEAYEQVFTEIIAQADIVSSEHILLAQGIKGDEIISSIVTDPVIQAYSCNPSASGDIDLVEALSRPKLQEFYDKFCPTDLRYTRFQSKEGGAINNMDNEFTRIVAEDVLRRLHKRLERNFWGAISAAWQTSIGSSALAQSYKTWASTAPNATSAAAGQFNGIIAKLIWDGTAAVNSVKVTGTTLTTLNIITEMNKVVAAIPSDVFSSPDGVRIFAPHAVKQLLTLVSAALTNTNNAIVFNADGTVTYAGVTIVFTELPANVMVAGVPQMFMWLCDMESDMEYIHSERLPFPSKEWGLNAVWSMETHVNNATQAVLYL